MVWAINIPEQAVKYKDELNAVWLEFHTFDLASYRGLENCLMSFFLKLGLQEYDDYLLFR